MKIENIKITGFRGFENFEVTSSDLTGFIILAGQNGTGKSTILEVTNFILNSVDINQIDATIVNGITADKAVWKITGSFNESEIKYLSGLLTERNPQAFPSSEQVFQNMCQDLTKISDRYHFTTEVAIPLRFPDERPTRTFLGSSSRPDVPSWYAELGRSKVLVAYIKPLQDISEGGTTFLGGTPRATEMMDVLSGDFDLRQRSSRTNIQLGNLLNRLAMMDIWNVFKNTHKTFPLLENALERINYIISPLELNYDKNQIEKGEIKFKMTNTRIDKSYPIQFASSGERQVIGLAGMLLQWERQEYKPVVLIDEPDIHLHPEYVTRLAEFMKGVFSQASDFSCLIATHSPDLISVNAENVYQITSDAKSIEKIDNLSSRVELLHSLGKRFDLAYLIPKIIYVEGVEKADNQLEDYKIYQRLIDPKKCKVVFIPAGIAKVGSGSKGGVVKATTMFIALLESLSQYQTNLKVFALVDKDLTPTVDTSKYKNVIPTPFTNLENLFLLDKEALKLASTSGEKEFTVDEINTILGTVEQKALTEPLKVDGKKVLKDLYQEFVKTSQYVKSLTYKGFQEKILQNIDTERYPDEVKQFIEQLKS
ncbi:MAG: AAA family ATPase [Patescibacteria group bacterium]|nr:AAA family ATPase [Patescibacteria group bacterium]